MIPAAPVPGLEQAFEVTATLGPLEDHGTTRVGHRRVVPIAGGRVTGLIDAVILPGGADWQVIRPDGTIEVAARYTIRSAAGSLVYVQNDGLRVASPEILARMSKGELVPFDSYRFRTAPRFETSDPSLKWMETSTFVGAAARTPDRVVIGFHEVF